MTPETNNTHPQQDVIADYAAGLQQLEVEGYERTVRKARNALFWAGGLIFTGEMISMLMAAGGFNLLILIIALIEAGVFIALAYWTKKKPFTAVIMGLGVFTGIIILNIIASAIADGGAGLLKGLFSGIFVKTVILINLILPLRDAKALQAAKEQPNQTRQ